MGEEGDRAVVSAAIPVVAEPTSTFDTEIEARRRDGDADYTGWFCIRTDPFPCPAAGCTFVANHLTGAHRIIVWSELDDPQLLSAAHSAKSAGRNPRVVGYEIALGPCIAWDEFERLGRPVHGRAARPDGFEPMRRL